jgi:hypothetical protein
MSSRLYMLPAAQESFGSVVFASEYRLLVQQLDSAVQLSVTHDFARYSEH